MNSEQARSKRAERLTATITASARLNEAVGAVRSWQECDTAVARQYLRDQDNAGGVDAEAVNIAEALGDGAHGRADPDWE
jgi:hypothetical protein